MTDQDYIFLPSVSKVVKVHPSSDILEIEDCGHVVNVEKPDKFNIGMLGFLNESVS